jgi:hypothetical protein
MSTKNIQPKSKRDALAYPKYTEEEMDTILERMRKTGDLIDVNGMSDSEIDDLVDKELNAQLASGSHSIHENDPALKDAWEKIKTIRALTEKRDVTSGRSAWEKHFYDILDGPATDNKALEEAWNEYIVLKTLKGK